MIVTGHMSRELTACRVLSTALPVLFHLNFPPSQDAGADEETEARGLLGHSGRVNSQWGGKNRDGGLQCLSELLFPISIEDRLPFPFC